jgi:hypothetical protein
VQQIQPHVSAMIIHEEKKIFPASRCWRRDRSAQISVDQLQWLCGSESCLLREWERRCLPTRQASQTCSLCSINGSRCTMP